MDLNEVIDMFESLQEDSGVPKNLKSKLDEMVKVLKDESVETNMRITQVLDELDEISQDINLPSFVRTSLWSISSRLETY